MSLLSFRSHLLPDFYDNISLSDYDHLWQFQVNFNFNWSDSSFTFMNESNVSSVRNIPHTRLLWFKFEMSPHRLNYLNTWSHMMKLLLEIMELLGSAALLEEACHWVRTLGVCFASLTVHSLLHGFWRCDFSASFFCCHDYWLLPCLFPAFGQSLWNHKSK